MGDIYRLAVDLGTSNTVAVVRRSGGQPKALLFDGSPLLPSCVYVTAEGELHTGRDAERMTLLDPSRFEPHPKQRIDDGSMLLGDTEIDVKDLLAAVLRRVALEAANAGAGTDGAVLTCPADWGTSRRQVLLDAATRAGYTDVTLVTEPVAAATYCIDVLKQQIEPGQSILVFDLGGGTLDVTVVRRDVGQSTILATGGLEDLGGLDIDQALIGHLGQLLSLRYPEIWRRITDPSSTSEQRDRRFFWNEVRGAKEMLSRASTAPVAIPKSEDALHLTRGELERLAGPLVARAIDECRRIVDRAGLGPKGLAGIFLVGGSSRLPLVASRLHTRFGIAPIVPEQPELPVAFGALEVRDRAMPRQPAKPPVAPAGFRTTPGTATPVGAAFPRQSTGVPHTSTSDGLHSATFDAVNSPTSGAPDGPTTSQPSLGGPISGSPISPAVGPIPGARLGTLPPVRRRGRGWIPLLVGGVAVLSVLGVLISLTVNAGLGLWQDLQQGTNNGVNNDPTGTNGNNPSDNNAESNSPGNQQSGREGILTETVSANLDQGGAAAATISGDTLYYGTVEVGKTIIQATSTDGKSTGRWRSTLSIEPEGLTLRAVSTVLIVDGKDSATDSGDDMRIVLDLATGKQLWKRNWEGNTHVGFVGTDEIYETRGSTDNNAATRVNLKTGQTVWTRPGPQTLLLIDNHQMEMGLVWPDGKLKSEQLVSEGFRESIQYSTTLVELNNHDDTASVLDINTGRPKVTQRVLLDDQDWVVYGGVLVGTLNSEDPRGAGRTVLAGYRTTDLKESWTLAQRAGDRVEEIKPCGQTVVCMKLSAGGKYSIIAVDVNNGQKKWSMPLESGESSPQWRIVAGQLIFGQAPFGELSAPRIIKDGSVNGTLGTGTTSYAYSSSGNRVAVVGLSSGGGTRYQVAVYDLSTKKFSPSVDIGEKSPDSDQILMTDNQLAIVTEAKVQALRVDFEK